MNPYFSSIIAAILTGIHIFSIKYIKIEQLKKLQFFMICFFSLFIWGLSRYFIYISSDKIPITIIHMILNMSIIVSTIISIFIYKVKIKWSFFIIGLLFILGGIYFILNCIDI